MSAEREAVRARVAAATARAAEILAEPRPNAWAVQRAEEEDRAAREAEADRRAWERRLQAATQPEPEERARPMAFDGTKFGSEVAALVRDFLARETAALRAEMTQARDAERMAWQRRIAEAERRIAELEGSR